MRRRAKILCGFGFIELLGAILVLAVFAHTPSPWGAGTLPGGLGRTDLEMNAIYLYQARVFLSCFGAGLMGIVFLLGGGLAYLVSMFTP